MKKIKMLVNSIVNGSIGTQIVAGVVAVSVLGGAAFGGYKVYENLSGTKQERLNKNVDSLKSKIVELKSKASKLPSSDEVNDLQVELMDLEYFDIANNYDEAYDRYIKAEDKYEELLKNYKAEMETLLKELESLDVSKFNETQLQEFEIAVQNYKVVTNMEEFGGYKSMYEEAKRVYDRLVSEQDSESDKNAESETSSEEKSDSSNNSTASNNSGSTNTGSTSTNSGSTNSGSTNTGSTNSGSTSSNSGSTNKPSNSGSTNSGSTNSGSANTGSTNTGSSNSDSTNTTPINPEPSTPQYETFNGFSYNLDTEGYKSGYIGGNNDYSSRYSVLSSKSTVSSFVSEANKAIQSLTQGAYDDKVKSKFMNKLYNGKYLITGVSINRYTVPIIDNGELVVDPYPYLVNQGIENLPSGLFATVVGNYGDLNGQEGYDSFVRIVIEFKEI